MLRMMLIGLLVLTSCDSAGRPFDATVDDASADAAHATDASGLDASADGRD